MQRMVADFLYRKASAPSDPEQTWTTDTASKAEAIRSKLISGVPIQYVLHESWFDGNAFYVDESVLIPRPETEELLDWIKKDLTRNSTPNQILEIGTGSGILAVSLKKAFPHASVLAIDVDERALRIAQKNAQELEAQIAFLKLDFTDEQTWDQLPNCDLLVSNPPYIPLSEKRFLPDHVVLHEPHLALFTPTEDPLLFYRLIATYGRNKLSASGRIYVELHEEQFQPTQTLFEQLGYWVTIRTDMQGKKRMLRAMKPA